MKNYYIILSFIALFLFSGLSASAGYCVTLGDGDWDDPANWSCGRVPGSGDTIIISANDSIYVASSYNGLTGVWLQVYGKLDFKNAARIVFMYGDTSIAPSMITFYTGSSCINGNGSSGLSFGSGGSGCDVYRPGQGTNPGVYPTIPGSYYDGCVWASYLPLSQLNANVYLIEDRMNIDWTIYENNSVSHYDVYGVKGETQIPLDYIQSQDLGYIQADYQTAYSYAGLDAIRVVATLHNGETMDIALGVVLEMVPQISGSIGQHPNPFDEYLDIEGKYTFNVKIYTLEGQLVYEGSGANSYHINTSSFKKGIYFVESSSQTGIIDRRKILKN